VYIGNTSAGGAVAAQGIVGHVTAGLAGTKNGMVTIVNNNTADAWSGAVDGYALTINGSIVSNHSGLAAEANAIDISGTGRLQFKGAARTVEARGPASGSVRMAMGKTVRLDMLHDACCWPGAGNYASLVKSQTGDVTISTSQTGQSVLGSSTFTEIEAGRDVTVTAAKDVDSFKRINAGRDIAITASAGAINNPGTLTAARNLGLAAYGTGITNLGAYSFGQDFSLLVGGTLSVSDLSAPGRSP
jgi:hypothetical protein